MHIHMHTTAKPLPLFAPLCPCASQSPPDSPTTRLSLATNVLIDQTGYAWLVVA
jgi:hypothetical protein